MTAPCCSTPAAPWLSDADVGNLAQRRRDARLRGDFTASDLIRSGLAALGVFLLDTAVDEGGCTKTNNPAGLVESRHTPAAAAGSGVSWVRAAEDSADTTSPAAGHCKFWHHKSRSYCAAPVVGIESSREEVWTAVREAAAGNCAAAAASPPAPAAAAAWVDSSRLHYCAGCTARRRLARRCPCPFDPRHSVLLPKLSGHLRVCQSKPGASAAAAAGEGGAAVPKTGPVDGARQAGANSFASGGAQPGGGGGALLMSGAALLPAHAEGDAVAAAARDMALLAALAERMAAAISTLTSSPPQPLPLHLAAAASSGGGGGGGEGAFGQGLELMERVPTAPPSTADSTDSATERTCYERVAASESSMHAIPFECYEEGGAWMCGQCNGKCNGKAQGGGGWSRRRGHHTAQHVSIGYHLLGAVGDATAGDTAAGAPGRRCSCGCQTPGGSGNGARPNGTRLIGKEVCLIEFCAGKALLAKQICAMIHESSSSAVQSNGVAVEGEAKVSGQEHRPQCPQLDVLLVDRTEVRNDAFVAAAFVTARAQQQQQQQGGGGAAGATAGATAGAMAAAAAAADSTKLSTVVRSHARLTVDIADLCLGRVPAFQQTACSLAIGKHLCGVATDLTLRCYVKAVAAQAAAAHSAAAQAAGLGGTKAVEGRLALALCCHHLCEWGGYVDTNWLARHGLGPGEFKLMKHLATKYRTHPCRSPREGAAAGAAAGGASSPWAPLLAGTAGARLAASRASCGVLAKRCLNEGRAAWLKEQPGWGSVRLVRYVGEAESPENVLLLGVFSHTDYRRDGPAT